jgi:hypothetical protein
MSNWVEVRSFSNNIEAEIAKSALEGAGIKSQIQIEDIVGGLFGLYPGMLAIRLLVHKERVIDAKKILQALRP